MVNAEIIAVGTELLMGQVVNTNATTIARELNSLHIPIYYQTVVGDNQQRLLETLQLASKRSRLIVLCGGIGPTEDDLTKQTLALFLQKNLVIDEPAKQIVETYFARRQKTMTENNLRQALCFADGVVFKNQKGFAVGIGIEVEGVTYIVLPGPPSELTVMLTQEVVPYLQQRFAQERLIESRILRYTNIGESALASLIADDIDTQTNPTIAIYASVGDVIIRLTANGDSKQACQLLLDDMQERLNAKLADYFYGCGESYTLAQSVADLLVSQNLTISVAESLTGGLCQSELVAISGASQFFAGGIVAYQQTIKETVLSIDKAILSEHGTISRACAIAMAEAIRKQMQSDIGLAFTGIADSNSVENKQAGTVYIAIARANQLTICQKVLFARDRNTTRLLATLAGLNYVRQTLIKEIENGN